MIDLHCHILSGLDDGPETIEESIEMCRISYRDGVRTIVATPHTLNGVYRNNRSLILNKVLELNNEINKSGIGEEGNLLKILPGADVHLCEEVLQRFNNGEITTLGDRGRFLFLEFPSQGIPFGAEEVIFQLMGRGITPIITHPERNIEILQRPRRYFEMVRKGCLGQVTAMSLTGGFGLEVKRFAERLLKNRLIHFIASDAHSLNGRSPGISAAVKSASVILGKEEAQKMVEEYPKAVLESRRPNIPEPLFRI